MKKSIFVYVHMNLESVFKCLYMYIHKNIYFIYSYCTFLIFSDLHKVS